MVKNNIIPNTTDFRVKLSAKADKNLTLFKVYNDLASKQDAIIMILEQLDIKECRDEYFLKDNEVQP